MRVPVQVPDKVGHGRQLLFLNLSYWLNTKVLLANWPSDWRYRLLVFPTEARSLAVERDGGGAFSECGIESLIDAAIIAPLALDGLSD